MNEETDLRLLSFWTRKTAAPVRQRGTARWAWEFVTAVAHSLPTGATVTVASVTDWFPVFMMVTERESFETLEAVIWMFAVYCSLIRCHHVWLSILITVPTRSIALVITPRGRPNTDAAVSTMNSGVDLLPILSTVGCMSMIAPAVDVELTSIPPGIMTVSSAIGTKAV